ASAALEDGARERFRLQKCFRCERDVRNPNARRGGLPERIWWCHTGATTGRGGGGKAAATRKHRRQQC
ncbi:unnamed protein product, partial [Symbiodinium sp. CCMP2456]